MRIYERDDDLIPCLKCKAASETNLHSHKGAIWCTVCGYKMGMFKWLLWVEFFDLMKQRIYEKETRSSLP